jgi:predicted MPP superfamily phosphohydrolase
VQELTRRRLRRVGEFVLRWALRIALPLAGASAMLHLFPYHAIAGGVRFKAAATLFTRSGITADTTFGSWIFGNVDGLPIGIHLSPQNVDVVKMASAATADPQAYVDSLREDFSAQVPKIVAWLAGEALLGVLLGLLVSAAVNLAVRQLRGLPRRERELRLRGRQLAASFAVLVVVAAYGAASYNPDWTKQSRLTGTLGALQLFPGQLRAYYQQRATAFDVVSGIASIQAQLQQRIEQKSTPPTSFNIMYISDMHLAGTYPLVQQYAQNFDVSLIINTGDESQFGTAAELSPGYVAQITSLTKVAPMIWLAGNHDSPTTAQIMAKIPGVTVLGGKTTDASGGFAVTAQQLQAFGLHIAAIPDPRVYGAAGVYGADDDKLTDPLERGAMDHALQKVSEDDRFDIFATHEPVAADEIAKVLDGRVRQTNSGHTHKQNADSEVQGGKTIKLVEGSTGAGGLKEVGLEVKPSPVAFSIESVAQDCQFTKVVRFQVNGAAPTSTDLSTADAQNVTASTLYLKPQDVADGRTCSTTQGISTAAQLS